MSSEARSVDSKGQMRSLDRQAQSKLPPNVIRMLNQQKLVSERKNFTPHMMLNGDDQVLVNASSTFSDARCDIERHSKTEALSTPQKA